MILLLIWCFRWLNSKGSLSYLSCLDSENQQVRSNYMYLKSYICILLKDNLEDILKKKHRFRKYLEEVLKKNYPLPDISRVS